MYQINCIELGGINLHMKNMTRDQCRRGYTTVTWYSGQLSESPASRQALTSSDTVLPVPAETHRQAAREEHMKIRVQETKAGLALAFFECLNQQIIF